MSYFREFTAHWPNLLGAALGLGFGTALNHYMMNLFGPALIAEFGWSKSEFALVGALGLAGVIFTPAAGLITDRFGPRNSAIIGFTALPIGYLLLSFMTGSIWQFYGILLFKYTFGILTATMVFTRVVVERFDRARGLALACLLSCPPLVGAIAAPLMGGLIAGEGWRVAYRVMALVAAVAGLAAITLVGRNLPTAAERAPHASLGWAECRELCRNPIFPLLMGGMFLCNFPQALVSSQMSIMLMESGASIGFATGLVSVYAISVVIGRFASGFALDRISPHLVAIVALGLPAIGFVALASAFDARWVLAGSIALVGLAQGAETDVSAILTSRQFELQRYSFVFSMLMTSMAIASSLGSMLLSFTLIGNGNFNAFLLISAAATLGGAMCFFLTGSRTPKARDGLQGEIA